MKILRYLGVAQQLAAGFGIAVAILLVQSWIGSKHIQHTQSLLRIQAHQALEDYGLSLAVQRALSDEELYLRRMSVQVDSERIAREADGSVASGKLASKALQTLATHNLSAEDSALLGQLSALSSKALPLRDQVIALAKAMQTDQANSLFDERLDTSLNQRQAVAMQLEERQKAYLLGTLATISAQADQAQMVILVSNAVGILIAVAVAVLLHRSITQPLNEAVKVAHCVAEGNLRVTVALDQRNEIGQLMRALDQMARHMGSAIGGVREASDSILTAAAEIAAGNMDLSRRTEHQASAIEVAGSSIEDITNRVTHNAESARQAQRQAREAAEIAVDGGEKVRRFVNTIEAISRSSHQMSDIVGVIDGIAFQTNILALNAAVEAARAGEQGRGFAVVATEVRTLAQRSATAARGIKGLIEDNLLTVKNGVSQAAEAGATIGIIAETSKRVADVVTEISDSTDQQASSISQVHLAINDIDEGVRQNAALVEQAAAAAASLRGQTEHMDQRLGYFKV